MLTFNSDTFLICLYLLVNWVFLFLFLNKYLLCSLWHSILWILCYWISWWRYFVKNLINEHEWTMIIDKLRIVVVIEVKAKKMFCFNVETMWLKHKVLLISTLSCMCCYDDSVGFSIPLQFLTELIELKLYVICFASDLI